MIKPKIFLLILCLLLVTSVSIKHFKQTSANETISVNEITASNQTNKTESLDIIRLEIPLTATDNEIIHHTGFSLLYNEEHEQAAWVAYKLTGKQTKSTHQRTDKFMPDPKVTTFSATYSDYRSSGYDRGHLAPAADMGWSETSMAESFYYSNMSPQLPNFNRGIWKKLEERVRAWAMENDSVYIVAGPVLSSGLPTIGENRVSVPKYFYKVILDYTLPEINGIGFVISQHSKGNNLVSYAVSIDSVEKLTGIDFFHQLPDDIENELESKLCLECWSW